MSDGPVTSLWHGSSASCWNAILDEGIEAPSYWGTQGEAAAYDAGLMLEIDISRFEDDALAANDLLIEALREQNPEDEGILEWDASKQTWRDSLRIFGSVRYDLSLPVDESDLRPRSPQP